MRRFRLAFVDAEPPTFDQQLEPGLGVEISWFGGATGIDPAAMLTSDLAVIGSLDLRTLRFLVDLPVHTKPTMLICLWLDFVTLATPETAAEIVQRVDSVIGTPDQFQRLGANFRQFLTGYTSRYGFVLDEFGLTGTDKHEILASPARQLDRWGTAAGVAAGLLRRQPLSEVLELGIIAGSFGREPD